MSIKPCEFNSGACVHCGDTERGECEGWVPETDELAALRAENEELRTRLADVEKDAARLSANAYRYLWLRERAYKSNGNLEIEIPSAYDHYVRSSIQEGLDAAIDAAIGAES